MLDEQQQQQPQPEQALLVDWTLPQSSYYDSNGSNFEEIAATVAAASDAAVDTHVGDEEVEGVFVHSRSEDRTVDTAPAEDNAACLAADRIHKSVDKEPLPKDGSKVMVA